MEEEPKDAGSEVLTSEGIKSSILWDKAPYLGLCFQADFFHGIFFDSEYGDVFLRKVR
jgi:hypothetical protein